MSTATGKKGSPRIDQPGSRTSSPMDLNNNNNNDNSNNLDSVRTEDPQVTQSESKDKQSVDAETVSRRIGQTTTESEGDYFSGVHHLSLEPNPFEQSFGNTTTTAETPGKSLLPPVAALTSPSIPGTSNPSFNWANSLRAGPLSPAMLPGPTTANDYFDNIGRGFPTPNESSLRTGLTPGGGGSMFPAPSPSAQGVFPHLQSGGATPSTLEFQRTALNVARKSSAPTSNPQEPDQILPQPSIDIPKSVPPMEQYTHPDATDAANGLFMLAKGAQASSAQFVGQTSQPMPAPVRETFSGNGSSMNGTALPGMQNGENQGIQVNGNASDVGDQGKSGARGKGKKPTTKSTTTTNGRRKAEDTKSSNKRQKGTNGTAVNDKESENQGDAKPTQESGGSNNNNNKKLTDEEKRRNFLERNRVAALKCRQRKKAWLNNLQAKVEMYSNENDTLSATVAKLREEIVSLKSLLLAHKDCPLAQAQGIGAYITNSMNGIGPEYPMPNPYSMPMQPQPNATIPAGLQRR
ncbi:hypothetical protein VTO42DRAFT_5344 [Malbranchea cinnamomea]